MDTSVGSRRWWNSPDTREVSFKIPILVNRTHAINWQIIILKAKRITNDFRRLRDQNYLPPSDDVRMVNSRFSALKVFYTRHFATTPWSSTMEKSGKTIKYSDRMVRNDVKIKFTDGTEWLYKLQYLFFRNEFKLTATIDEWLLLILAEDQHMGFPQLIRSKWTPLIYRRSIYENWSCPKLNPYRPEINF